MWLLGGGLGGTRRGGPDVNIKHSGREDNERERERYRLEREREDRGGGGGGMDRRPDFRDRGGDRKFNKFIFFCIRDLSGLRNFIRIAISFCIIFTLRYVMLH